MNYLRRFEKRATIDLWHTTHFNTGPAIDVRYSHPSYWKGVTVQMKVAFFNDAQEFWAILFYAIFFLHLHSIK